MPTVIGCLTELPAYTAYMRLNCSSWLIRRLPCGILRPSHCLFGKS